MVYTRSPVEIKPNWFSQDGSTALRASIPTYTNADWDALKVIKEGCRDRAVAETVVREPTQLPRELDNMELLAELELVLVLVLELKVKVEEEEEELEVELEVELDC